jgi:outer membrane lipoprotein SlyB
MNKLCATIVISSLLSGCAGGSLTPTTVNRTDARSSCPAQEGVVLEAVSTTIQSNQELAQGVGAGLVGYAANQATENKNDAVRAIATVAGAGVGSVIGNAVSKTQNKQGVELIMSVDGRVFSVIQEMDSVFQKGDAVWVIGYNVRYGQQCSSGVRVLPRS